MKQDKIINQETYSISTFFSSNYSKGLFKEQNLELSQNYKYISQQLVLYLFQKTNQEEQQNLSFIEQDYQQLIQYILDYQYTLINRGKHLYTLLKEEYEDNISEENQNPPIFQILNKAIQKMLNGLNTTLIFQNTCLSGIHLLYTLNNIQQQQNEQCQLQNENNRITILNIISNKTQNNLLLQQKFSRILQNFTIIIDSNNYNYSDLFKDKNCYQKSLVLQNQYFLPIQFRNQQQKVKVTSEIQNLYKYFLKKKIIQFNPKIIILGIEIDNNFEIDPYFLKKIIYQLDKISQNQLIILPIRKNDVNQEQYRETLIQCITAINTYHKTKKNHIQQNNNGMRASNYLAWIESISQTNKEKEFYKKQFQSLNLLQKFEQSINDTQTTEGIFKFPIININDELEYVILEDQENGEYIYIDSDTKYYVSYIQETIENKLIISIIKNQQLYWGEVNFLDIEIKDQNQKKIKLEKIAVFQDNPNSSFLLDQYKFYQVTLDVNQMNQFVGTVIIYTFNANQDEVVKFSVKNDHEIIGHVKGFTVIKHSDASFSLLSGCLDGQLYQQIGIKLDLVQQNSLKLNQYQKQNNNLPKGYNYPLIAKIEPNKDQDHNSYRYLYFESQTKYFAIPFQSEIYQIYFQQNLSNPSCKSDTIKNVTNIQLFEKYSKLFRSDQINLKYKKHSSNMLLFELVVFEQTFERNNLEYTFYHNKDIVLQKQTQWNYLHFKFYYYIKSAQTQLKIDLNINSIFLKSKNDNLNSRCLYNNWLEDQNFQHVFQYNTSQHIYLFYYQKDKSGQYLKKKFVFYCLENQKDFIPFDEVMINDYYNNVIWIVRKYYDRNSPYLVIYRCHWMRLQDIKDDDINTQIKVWINKILEINIISQEFELIGLEVQKRDNMLLICSSTFICQIPISKIRNLNFNFLQNSQKQITEEQSLYEIFYTQLNISNNIPIILLNFNETMIAFFYQYCTVNCLDQKQGLYQIEIIAKIWSQYKQLDENENIDNNLIQSNCYDNINYYDQEEYLDNQILIKQSFNYEASNTLILAKLISIQVKGEYFQTLIFFELEFNQFFIGQYQFSQNSNSIVKLRMVNLQESYGKIQFLKSISTNKYETLFLSDKSPQLILSESSLESFLNEKTNEDLGQKICLNVQQKQQQLIN